MKDSDILGPFSSLSDSLLDSLKEYFQPKGEDFQGIALAWPEVMHQVRHWFPLEYCEAPPSSVTPSESDARGILGAFLTSPYAMCVLGRSAVAALVHRLLSYWCWI